MHIKITKMEKMLPVLLALMAASLMLAGCETAQEIGTDEQQPSPDIDGQSPIGGSQEMLECRSDADCRKGGCSGTICESIHSEPTITTCEYREEYVCYNLIDCSCIDSRCLWEETEEFIACIDDKRSDDIVHIR